MSGAGFFSVAAITPSMGAALPGRCSAAVPPSTPRRHHQRQPEEVIADQALLLEQLGARDELLEGLGLLGAGVEAGLGAPEDRERRGRVEPRDLAEVLSTHAA